MTFQSPSRVPVYQISIVPTRTPYLLAVMGGIYVLDPVSREFHQPMAHGFDEKIACSRVIELVRGRRLYRRVARTSFLARYFLGEHKYIPITTGTRYFENHVH